MKCLDTSTTNLKLFQVKGEIYYQQNCKYEITPIIVLDG